MKILLFRLGAIGDVVQCAVALEAFRREPDRPRITFVINKAIHPLLELFEVADHILPVDEAALSKGRWFSRIRALLSFALKVRSLGRFDEVVVPYFDWRYHLLARCIRARSRRRYRQAGRRPSPINNRNRVFEIWRLLIGQEGLGMLPIVESSRILGQRILNSPTPALMDNLPSGYVVLVPGGARNLHSNDNLRRWPIERYVEVARHLSEAGETVVIVGGPDDDWTQPAFVGLDVIDLIGRTSLVELAHVMVRAALVISHDCGPLHLAVLGKAAIIALFGPTPENAVFPLARPRSVVFAPGNRIACSPCYGGRSYARCSRALCMESTAVASVMEAAKRLMQQDS